MNRNSSPAYAAFVLRIGLGVVFLAHAFLKLFVFSLPGTAAWFEGVGLPGVLAYPVFLTELGGGLLLLAGVHTTRAALALLPVALGATVVHWPNGWVFTNTNGGWEYTAFLATACVALSLLRDDGAFAVSQRANR